jgi:hypothetical protein
MTASINKHTEKNQQTSVVNRTATCFGFLPRHQQTVLYVQDGLYVPVNLIRPDYGRAKSQNALAVESPQRTRVYRIFGGV